MASKPRQWLVKSIRELLLPEFEERGFQTVPLDANESREVRSAFPFGRHRRTSPPGFEMLEIQLDKRDVPAFSINIGTVPKEGITTTSGHFAAKDVWVHNLDRVYELYRYPKFRRWFSIRRWPWQTVNESDYVELIKEVAELIPEIEQLLKDGKIGPHIRFTSLTRK